MAELKKADQMWREISATWN